MNNEYQPILNWFFAAITFLAGFILRSIWSGITQMQKDLAELQKKMSDDYVRRDDFQILAAELKATLIRIEAKIDGKADK